MFRFVNFFLVAMAKPWCEKTLTLFSHYIQSVKEMTFIKVRRGGPPSENMPFTASEFRVFYVIKTEGFAYQNQLIKKWEFSPQSVSRTVQRLEERGYIYSKSGTVPRKFYLTEKGKGVIQNLWFKPILNPNYKLLGFGLLEADLHKIIINAGGGTCEIARKVGQEFEHVHFPFLASAIIPQDYPLYVRTVDGKPILIVLDPV